MIIFSDVRDLFQKPSLRSPSLVEQIRLAEERLLVSQASVDSCITHLGKSVRQRMTSAESLMWAVGIGFAAGEFARRGSATRSPSRDDHIDRPAYRGVIPTILEYVTVIRPLVANLSSFWKDILNQFSQKPEMSETRASSSSSAMHATDRNMDSSPIH